MRRTMTPLDPYLEHFDDYTELVEENSKFVLHSSSCCAIPKGKKPFHQNYGGI